VAVAYALCYILLQMGTYAMLTGSLVLFVVLAVIMYYTAGIEEPDLLQQNV
jgi:inner membrane protein involved in colicin E2 resistance